MSGQQCASIFLNSAFTRVAVSVADVSGSEGFMCDGSSRDGELFS